MGHDDALSVLYELLKTSFDSVPTKNENYAKQLMCIHEEFAKRNTKLTNLLEDFLQQRKERVKTNTFLKKFIFWFFVGLLSLLTIALAVFVLFNLKNDTVPSMVSILSVSVTYFASLIAIVEIISKYLFPTDEEKDTIAMIQTVIDNDVKVEELMSNVLNTNPFEAIERLRHLNQLLNDGVLTEDEFKSIKNEIIQNMRCE